MRANPHVVAHFWWVFICAHVKTSELTIPGSEGNPLWSLFWGDFLWGWGTDVGNFSVEGGSNSPFPPVFWLIFVPVFGPLFGQFLTAFWIVFFGLVFFGFFGIVFAFRFLLCNPLGWPSGWGLGVPLQRFWVRTPVMEFDARGDLRGGSRT